MTTFRFDILRLDASEFGSQGSAVLGIRDSGKTYTATALAEKLYDAGVPFVAFDPIGVWRFLRVPGAHKGGRGYPIVVAGGSAGDLPLTPATASAIVEAAMREGVSLVIDLFHMDLSKADWRRIVKDCVRLLLHKNKPHGLRHVFLEEAAEFAPQKVLDGDVYAEIEKLARMGGNSRLGYTLINQRAEEVNKAVLELCDNLFLHRQKGRNSLTALSKWLDVGGVKQGKAVIESLATLPQGECWAWLAGADHATKIAVPRKNSLHPDRRVMRGDEDTTPGKGAVDVGRFVAALQEALPKLAEEAEQTDPKKLAAKIAKLQRALAAAQKHPAAAPQVELSVAQIEEVRRTAFVEGARSRDTEIAEAFTAGADAMLERLQQGAAAARAKLTPPKPKAIAAPPRNVTPAKSVTAARPPARPVTAAPKSVTPAPDGVTPYQLKLLSALAFWSDLQIPTPSRAMIAAAAEVSVTSSTFEKYLSQLRSAGYIDFPSSGTVTLTAEGVTIAPPPAAGLSVREALRRILTPYQETLLDALPQDGSAMLRDDLADAAGVSANSSTFEKYLSNLRGYGLITLPGRGLVAVETWVWS